MDKITVQLWRVGSERKPNGLGNSQAVIKTLVLAAKTQEQLNMMVAIAAVDGWRVNEP